MILANGHWILLCLLTSTTAFTTTLTKRTTTTKSPSRRASFSKIRQSQKLNRLPSHLKLSSFTVSNDEELTVGIEAINLSNNDLMAKLETLCDQPYFRLYSVDILGSCEYMPQELFECYTESCEIYPEEEEDVPEVIRSADMNEHYFELDGWARWDMPTSDYYNTVAFPEGYTGYDGSEVWEFIHERICFKGYDYSDDHWKADFNRAVSGLHSMISAQVIRGIREKAVSGIPFAEAEVWRDPQKEFQRRLGPNGETPQAMENLYFCFMLLLTAVSKAKQRLLEDCNAGRIDAASANDLKAVLSCSLLQQESVGVASRRLHDHAIKDSDSTEALWQARMRSRDLLHIMNCVQCNKCRLHGKISVLGLTTAMQVLVGGSGEGGDPDNVHRVELAALMTTLRKFSTAIKFCQDMKQ